MLKQVPCDVSEQPNNMQPSSTKVWLFDCLLQFLFYEHKQQDLLSAQK